MTERARPPQASQTTLKILSLLQKHFVHGLTNGDISKSTGISASQVVHHVAALEAEGFADRIPETGRIRPSVRHAQACYQITRSLEDAAARVEELKSRINRN